LTPSSPSTAQSTPQAPLRLGRILPQCPGQTVHRSFYPADIALEQQQIQTYAQAIEASLEAETVDSAWSGSTSQIIGEAFTGEELAGASLQDIDCRSTLCRVEVQHRDEAKLQEFQRLFPLKVSQALPRMMMHRIDNADGSITTYLYLARQGYRLPAADSGN